MRFLMSGFLHESIVPRPLCNTPKYFWKIFCFGGDIREYISDFRVTIPGSPENDPYMTPFFVAFKSYSYVCTNSTQLIFVYIFSLKAFIAVKNIKKTSFFPNSTSG